MSANQSYQKVRIINIIEETSDSKTFFLEGCEVPLSYEAGQYITFVFPKKNGKEDRRSYSFSSSPKLNEAAAITVKRIPNGEYSRMLMNAKAGDEFHFSDINGFFQLPKQQVSKQSFHFIAAGSGITPIFSLIKDLLAINNQSEITLFYSNKNPKSTIFFEKLTQLSHQLPDRLKIHFLFSEQKQWLSNYLILEHLFQKKTNAVANSLFYICGPFDFMETVFITLLTEGIPRENIRREHFNHSIPKMKLEPSDTLAHQVSIQLHQKFYHFTVQYPNSILTAALEQDLPLPFSCQSGQCGSCAAQAFKGKVWMAYNEVLTQKELDAGLVLTCTGYPIHGDVALSFD